jgi:hypothetical protein
MARPSNNRSTAATAFARTGFLIDFGLAMGTFTGTNESLRAGLRRAGSDARTKEERREVSR